MHRLASFVALLLVLSAAAPGLACMSDAAVSQMSREESACCREMHGNCGAMARTGCCRSEIQTNQHAPMAVKTGAVETLDLHSAGFVVWLAPVLNLARTIPSSAFQAPEEHSPPGLVTARITVLRI